MNPYYDAITHIGSAQNLLLAAEGSLESMEYINLEGQFENSIYCDPMLLADLYQGCCRAVIAVLGAIRDDTHGHGRMLVRFTEIVQDSEFSPEILEFYAELYGHWRLAKEDPLIWDNSEIDFRAQLAMAQLFVESADNWVKNTLQHEKKLKLEAESALSSIFVGLNKRKENHLARIRSYPERKAELLSV